LSWSKLTCSVFSALCLGITVGYAQDYPARPLHLVVPSGPGGGTDAIARFIARGLEQRLGQPVIVENRAGQGTSAGGAYVAKAAPDGYTLLMATSSTVAINPTIYKNLSYDPARDFAPIGLVAAVPFVLVAHPSLPVQTVDDLIRLATASPGALSYASGGGGAPHHVYMELFKHMRELDIRHIPYRGGAPALTDVLAGHVPMMFADAATALDLIRDRRLRALAVTTGKRLETLPDVPTMHEAGVTGYEANAWQCVVAPAGTPEPMVARLSAALTDVMAAPETQSRFAGLGMQPLSSTPAELGRYIRSELQRWALVLEAAGAGE
jgi:tripartite-type tricarboxylate transporter receptor subunit TctC